MELPSSWSFKSIPRDHPDYETARRSACWNGRVPDRFPELIFYPECEEHVRRAVGYANQHDLAVGVKSGGHSWTASFLRDKSILIEMARMNGFTVEVEQRIAAVQPAVHGGDLNDELSRHGLMFPGGHCPTVGMGGYLLQGGFGWNSRKWGLACQSLLAIDVVTADGELVRASTNENADLFWAARGAGCGFFGVVTKFYLRLHELPPATMSSQYVFAIEHLDEVVTAIDDASALFPAELEVSTFIGHDPYGMFVDAPTVAVVADVLAETNQQEATAALDIIHNLSPMKKALVTRAHLPCTPHDMSARLGQILDHRGRRYQCNNMWTDEKVHELLPALHQIIPRLGPAPTHLYLYWWTPGQRREKTETGMAFSLEGRLYIAIYAITTDPSKDAEHSDLVVEAINLIDAQGGAKGMQLADENLPLAPRKFMATQNYVRLERLRRRYDPHRRFGGGYVRVPEEFERAVERDRDQAVVDG